MTPAAIQHAMAVERRILRQLDRIADPRPEVVATIVYTRIRLKALFLEWTYLNRCNSLGSAAFQDRVDNESIMEFE